MSAFNLNPDRLQRWTRAGAWLALAAATGTTAPVWAWPPDIAPEFNFSSAEMQAAWRAQTNPTWIINPVSSRIRDEMRDKVKAACSECKIEAGVDRYQLPKYRVTFPDGWWFDITLDPACVEITAKPASLDFYVANEERLSKYVFEVTRGMGLTPDGAGHLNFGAEGTFGGDVRLFRNFIVDFFNHAELHRYIVHDNDSFNAPIPEDLSAEQHEAFKKLVDGFDFERGTIKEFSQRLMKEVYYKTTWDAPASHEPPDKYHSMNVKSIATDAAWTRLEMRSVREQHSMPQFIAQVKLFQARIEYLKRQGGLVKYEPPGRSINREAGIERYYRYSQEAGLAWTEAQLVMSDRMTAQVAAFNQKNNLPTPTGCDRIASGQVP